MMNICVFTRITNLISELRLALPNHKFIQVFEATDNNLKNSEVIIGDFDLLAPCINDFPNVKYVQGTWAGVDSIVGSIHKPLPFPIVRFSGRHFGQLISEYVITCMVNQERDMFIINENQKSKLWSRAGNIFDHRAISDLTVGILGVGNIGTWIAKCLNLLGATVLGFGRKSHLDDPEKTKYFSSYFSKPGFSEFLQQSDYLINILPHTRDTGGLLNGNVLEKCKAKQPVFINVGRGGIIGEKDLISALDNKWLSAAILDVFATEPLPPDSALWTTPNVRITPHISGVSKPRHIAEQFRENLEYYLKNEKIPNTINFENQY